MANLGIMNGAIFYKYDIHVFDNVLLGFLILKPSQIDDITSKGHKITSTSFYGITRSELIKQFISFLKKYDIKANKDDFLEGTIIDKRVDKTKPYKHDALILHEVSHKNIENNVKKPIQVKEDIIFKVDYSNKLYKVVLDLDSYGLGQGKKTLYDYNKDMLKDKIEAYFKTFKKNINAIIDANTIKDVGKVLINTVVYTDKVIGTVDLSSQGLPNIEVTATTKHELLDNIIKKLKEANLTGKLNWGSVIDKTKEVNKLAKNKTTLVALKSLQKKLVKHLTSVGLDENEIDGRIRSMIPNIQDIGVGTLGGNKVNLSYVLPWNLENTFIKKKKFAEDIAETHPDNVVIKEVSLSLYVLDSNKEELEVSIMADVKWVHTFFGQLREDSYTIIEDVVKINQDQVKANPQDLVTVKPNVPKEEPKQVEPPNREVEVQFKKNKVKDPEHLEQLNRMKAYIKKIADVVDADNDFALRFLEEPKEFQKYKLPTVGVGLFYYGDKSIAELEQNPLYKKVYRGRGLSILRKFFKTTDLNGEDCLLVLFVDNEYAKQSKAKLIKEALENNTTIKINGRDYKVKAILENQCVVESIAGDLYIDIHSDLIDLI